MTNRIFKSAAALAITASLATGAFAQTAEVFSLNVVGFQKITPVSNAMTFISLPFDTDDGKISNVVRGLQPGTSVGTADLALTWDPVIQRYVTCWLRTSDSNWHVQATGNPLATNVYLEPGVGVIISRPVSRTSQPVVVFVGDVVADSAITNRLVEGLNLVSYPYNTDILLTNLSLRLLGARGTSVGTSDSILMWDPVAQRFVTYWLRASTTNWHKQATGNPVASNVVIRTGECFFYQRQIGRGAFDWVETKPYTF